MTAYQHTRKRPAGTGRGFRSNHLNYAREATTGQRLPRDWRERLPDPAIFYAGCVAKLGKPNAQGWAQGCCPLHEDHAASLSVHVADPRGGWRCFAGCGAGDLVGFHMRLRGLGFVDAARDLLGVRHG